MIRRCCAGISVLLFVFALCVSTVKQAHANLMILPTNIVFEGRDRYAEVTLVNNGNVPKNYKLEWVYHRMLPESGAYEFLEDMGDEFDLSKHIVMSPRNVRLAPGAKQKVRLALRRPNDLAPGDYRAHLSFSAAPLNDDQNASEGKTTKANISFVVSYSIPVFLRVGEEDVKVELGQITMERNASNGRLEVLIPVKRSPESPFSVLGYFLMYHIDKDGNEEFVGELSNANVFREIDNRTLRALLTKEISGGALRIVLNKRTKDSSEKYAERIYPLE